MTPMNFPERKRQRRIEAVRRQLAYGDNKMAVRDPDMQRWAARKPALEMRLVTLLAVGSQRDVRTKKDRTNRASFSRRAS